jgi:hypothetical protein
VRAFHPQAKAPLPRTRPALSKTDLRYRRLYYRSVSNGVLWYRHSQNEAAAESQLVGGVDHGGKLRGRVHAARRLDSAAGAEKGGEVVLAERGDGCALFLGCGLGLLVVCWLRVVRGCWLFGGGSGLLVVGADLVCCPLADWSGSETGGRPHTLSTPTCVSRNSSVRGMSRMLFTPAQITPTGVRASSVRSALTSMLSSPPLWTPPMPPVTKTWYVCVCAKVWGVTSAKKKTAHPC